MKKVSKKVVERSPVKEGQWKECSKGYPVEGKAVVEGGGSVEGGEGEELAGGADAVDGGGYDAAGVAGTFSAGIKAGKTDVLKGLRITRQTHGRRGAGFHGKQQGLGGIVAAHLAVKQRKCLTQTGCHKVRKHS